MMKKLLLTGACLVALTNASWAAPGYGEVAVDMWKDSDGTHVGTFTSHNDKSPEASKRIAIIGCEAQGGREGHCKVVTTFGPGECWFTTTGIQPTSSRCART
jgi:hypothetical protein